MVRGSRMCGVTANGTALDPAHRRRLVEKGVAAACARKRNAILRGNRAEPDRQEPVVIYVKSGVATLTP
jgi:hypothetical protein